MDNNKKKPEGYIVSVFEKNTGKQINSRIFIETADAMRFLREQSNLGYDTRFSTAQILKG